ncbi:acetylornithine/succinylornithine family transaminase [Verrucomicrobiaceae bacterium N1E253]|uniref:Acetylornithine/succinylornithine family transaminase n=1 Tax=Oceaniferula marina TaxID=2748318 RepID=A0A851GC13_9BACT|nr:acetylornithine/succinylornithine family transaminase [Oceaniferula marina]NWK54719.1 acetylornithine/succinylornithine family transaminase [Oceaniferula marina]
MSYLLPTYANFPLTLVRGEGTRVWDENGTDYLDFCAGIATCSIGHCHPSLSEAIAKQASTLMHCSNLYQIPQQKELARTLVEDFVQTPGKIFFGNSGAEANDGMIKTARRYGHARPQADGSPRYEVITFKQSFHGRTLGSMAATAQTKIQQGFDPMLPGFRYCPFNDLDALRSCISETTVGIMLEPIQGEGGVHEARPEFLRGLAELCQQHDLLLMFDEIQCGLGRTGSLMGWQAICPELQPDTISWAKGLGGGFPIGAFYVSDRIIDQNGTELSSLMGPGSHGSTYGGNPLACAAALAVLEEIRNSQLADHAKQQEQQIRDIILSWNHPVILEIRGKGLLLGIALDPEQLEAPTLCQTLMSEGLLTVPAGPNTLRLLPPLNVSSEEINEALKILKNTLDSLCKN